MADHIIYDHLAVIQTTQLSTMDGPLGDPGFSTSESTDGCGQAEHYYVDNTRTLSPANGVFDWLEIYLLQTHRG